MAPSVSFDTSAIEPRHRHDALQEFFLDLLDVKSLAATEDEVRFSAQSWSMGSLFAGYYNYHSPILTFGGTGRKNTSEDMVILCITLKGEGESIVDGVPVQMRPGNVQLIDKSRPFRVVSENREMLILNIPGASATIGYDPLRHPACSTYEFDTPVGRVLRANIEAMLKTSPTDTDDEVGAMVDGLTAMLRAIITRNTREETARHHFERGRERALMLYVQQNLRDPGLSADRISKHMGLSRRALYRLFEADGGVVRHILRRRLECALAELSQSQPRRGLIGAVALRWAFPDQATFARQFRAHFRFRPSDVIGSLSQLPEDLAPSGNDTLSLLGVEPLISLLG